MNLVVYRSSVYHSGSSATGPGSWRDLPSDSSIGSGSYANESSGTIAVGDPLRDPDVPSDPNDNPVHAGIVVYAPAGGPYRIVDSNWVSGGSGNTEYIGSHTLAFSGSCTTDSVSNLSCYKNLSCIYNAGGCP